MFKRTGCGWGFAAIEASLAPRVWIRKGVHFANFVVKFQAITS
jgi:hypothetical protein